MKQAELIERINKILDHAGISVATDGNGGYFILENMQIIRGD